MSFLVRGQKITDDIIKILNKQRLLTLLFFMYLVRVHLSAIQRETLFSVKVGHLASGGACNWILTTSYLIDDLNMEALLLHNIGQLKRA